MISVTRVNDTTFEVAVKGRTATTHRVTVSDDVYQRLTGGNASREALVEKSFEFLLEREPNTSILRHFDLPLIGTYFPEYEAEMRAHFA